MTFIIHAIGIFFIFIFPFLLSYLLLYLFTDIFEEQQKPGSVTYMDESGDMKHNVISEDTIKIMQDMDYEPLKHTSHETTRMQLPTGRYCFDCEKQYRIGILNTNEKRPKQL